MTTIPATDATDTARIFREAGRKTEEVGVLLQRLHAMLEEMSEEDRLDAELHAEIQREARGHVEELRTAIAILKPWLGERVV